MREVELLDVTPEHLAKPENHLEFGATFTGTLGTSGFPLQTTILIGFLTPSDQVDAPTGDSTSDGIVSLPTLRLRPDRADTHQPPPGQRAPS